MGRMTSPSASPQRLSNTERHDAIAALRAHLDAGRITADEFAERSATAQAALTASEIDPLFADLPMPHPPYLSATQQTWNTYPGPGAPNYSAPEPGAPGPLPSAAPSYGSSGPVYSGTVVNRSQAPLPVRAQWLDTLHAVIWPVAILLMIFGNTGIWPVIVAIVISSVLGGSRGRRRRQPPPY